MNNLLHVDKGANGEMALKAYTLLSNSDLLSEITARDIFLQEIADRVDLTEAPEDAICSLVIDLMNYCEREKIDWSNDVVSRAGERFQSGLTDGSNRR